MRQVTARTNPKGVGVASNPDLSSVPLSSRQQHVANVLRSEIVSGALPPEGRMSTHLQLVDRFGVSALTGRHALNDLIRDGFLYSIPRTYVAPNSVTISAIGEDEPAGSQTSGVPAAADVLCGFAADRRSPGPRGLAVRHRASVCGCSGQRELLRRIK